LDDTPPTPTANPTLNLSDVADIMEKKNVYVVVLKNGKQVLLDKKMLPRSIYWRIKLRNRKRGFGI